MHNHHYSLNDVLNHAFTIKDYLRKNNILKFLLPIDEQIGVHNMDAKESAAGRMNSPRGPDLARGPEVADRWSKEKEGNKI